MAVDDAAFLNPAVFPGRLRRRHSAAARSVQSCPSSCVPPVLNPRYYSKSLSDSFWATTAVSSAPLWRFLLMSDGHVGLHLRILTENTVSLDLLESKPLPALPANMPNDPTLRKLVEQMHADREPALRRRQIVLRDYAGVPLLHATSWWHADDYCEIMLSGADNTEDAEKAMLWEAFRDRKLEVSRRMLAIHRGACPALHSLFGAGREGPYWGRDYVFRRKGRPLVVVSEIMSPSLDKYLGPMTCVHDPGDKRIGEQVTQVSCETTMPVILGG
jgi:chorismate-pyruvate lyase